MHPSAPSTLQGDELAWDEFGHLRTRQVGEVLETAVRRMERSLRRRGLLELGGADDDAPDPEAALAASAVSGREPPAGRRRLERVCR